MRKGGGWDALGDLGDAAAPAAEARHTPRAQHNADGRTPPKIPVSAAQSQNKMLNAAKETHRSNPRGLADIYNSLHHIVVEGLGYRFSFDIFHLWILSACHYGAVRRQNTTSYEKNDGAWHHAFSVICCRLRLIRNWFTNSKHSLDWSKNISNLTFYFLQRLTILTIFHKKHRQVKKV